MTLELAPFLDVPYAGHLFCRTFAARVLAAHGITVPRVVRPQDATDWQRVERPQPLDLVVFQTGSRMDHVGVCVGRGRFLHVEEGSRSRIEYLSSPLWSSRIEGFYRKGSPA